jgi:hypothetical protein
MATAAAHARPELLKSQSWKLTLGTWCVGDYPTDNEEYVGIASDKCGDNEHTLIISENQPKQLGCGFSTLLRVV